jgi:enamine deaminase RidA (YjgF/YER057c/UK114 family)
LTPDTYDLAQPYFIGMPHHVFLNDLKGYGGMNETFKGRFGDNLPVRTTIAAGRGIPGNSLVEIDVIAYI